MGMYHFQSHSIIIQSVLYPYKQTTTGVLQSTTFRVPLQTDHNWRTSINYFPSTPTNRPHLAYFNQLLSEYPYKQTTTDVLQSTIFRVPLQTDHNWRTSIHYFPSTPTNRPQRTYFNQLLPEYPYKQTTPGVLQSTTFRVPLQTDHSWRTSINYFL